ncbi:class I tRNA ligase family protein, partial [Candidatus Parcubacteria bacterium]|nr:class I tRNA ligase family protein [Candidatus Parcubacteria bacterium]
EDFDGWWPGIQIAGKDNLRQQSAIWQAMLMSAGFPTSTQIFVGGYINSGGQKMSKSLGNVINPYDLVKKYGTDATRYLLLRHVHPFEDTDVTSERLDEWYTANLVNGLGNLVARVMKLAEDHLPAPIAIPEPQPFPEKLTDGLTRFEFNYALDCIWERIAKADARMTSEEPFKLIKTDPNRAKQIIYELVTELYSIGRFLYAFMPETNEKIKQAVKENKKPENLFPRLG